MRKLLLVIILFIGCEKAPERELVDVGVIEAPVQRPPKFYKGDMIKLKDSDELGIITNITWSRDNNRWDYNVMYPEVNMIYQEKNMILHKRMVWFNHVQGEIHEEAKFEY